VRARLLRLAVFAAIGAVGLAAGAGVGFSVKKTATSTSTAVVRRTFHETRTRTVVKRRTIRPPAVTINHTVTEKVLAGGDDAVDYGDYAGVVQVRGVQAYITDIGARVLGQISAPSGCGGYVQIDATFYKDSQIADTQFTNFESLPAGSWVPFEINSTDLEGDFTYDLLVTEADC
jgi:hypothetical protein